MKGRLQLTALAVLAVAGAAFAQDDTTTTQGSTTSVTASSLEVLSGRSTLGALAYIMAHRSPEEASALVHALEALQDHSGPSFGANTGYIATEQVILGSLSGAEGDTLHAAWSNMSDFDKQSFTILARAAYFGGLNAPENVGGERPLRVFGDNNMWKTNYAPMGEVIIPEQRALDVVCGKLGAGGDAFRAAIASIEANPEEHPRNMGYVNAQKVLFDHIDEANKDAFMTAWNGMDYSDREGALVLVRDAFWGGLNDQ